MSDLSIDSLNVLSEVDCLSREDWESAASHIEDFFMELLEQVETDEHSAYDAMYFNLAHNIWEDGNFESHSLNWALEHADDEYWKNSLPPIMHTLVKASVAALLCLPLYENCYDAED